MNTSSEREDLIKEFEKEMYRIYEEAKGEYDYNGTRFFQMIRRHGGLEAAKRIKNDPTVRLEGFTKLFLKGGQEGLKLTVEALVLDPKWESLFDEEEKKIASDRMKRINYRTP